MKIYLSYSLSDKNTAIDVKHYLEKNNFEVLEPPNNIKSMSNMMKIVDDTMREADALVLIVSKYAFDSKWLKRELDAFILSDIYNEKSKKVIPILVDRVKVPIFLSSYKFIDFNLEIDKGLEQLKYLLTEKKTDKEITQKKFSSKYNEGVKVLSSSLQAGKLTLVCGAGVSIGAGIPSWNNLLLRLLESMIIKISKNQEFSFKNVSAQEFQKRLGSSSLMIGKYLKTNLGKDFLPELRKALYVKNPDSCNMIDSIVNLSRPQRSGKPLDSIITFNFDSLIEENLEKSNIFHKAIYEEGTRNKPSELPIYHVHGFLPRNISISRGTEIVFSEDAYHTQFIDPFSWANLIQLNKFNQNTCLFIGISLTDPNLRRLLDVSKRKDPSKNLNHYIVKKKPSVRNSSKTINNMIIYLEEQDANELGLNVVWVDDFDDIPTFLYDISDYN